MSSSALRFYYSSVVGGGLGRPRFAAASSCGELFGFEAAEVETVVGGVLEVWTEYHWIHYWLCSLTTWG